jgi:glycine oxidase
VVGAGSWSSLIAGLGIDAGAVRPARGQIVELSTPAPLLSGVVFGPRCYLVPRDDGRTLVGSTLEFVGYKKSVTARAVRDLLAAAIELCPALDDATLGRAWSNFRPYTSDERPLLGPAELPGLVLASGHYRNGILLAPISAEIVEAAVFGERSPIDLAPFRPERVRAAAAPARSGSSRPRRSRARRAR